MLYGRTKNSNTWNPGLADLQDWLTLLTQRVMRLVPQSINKVQVRVVG
jgi:hypothetical protein